MLQDTEREKCTALWQAHEPDLRRLCRVKLQSRPHEVDDVIADVFAALCEQTEKEGLPENPKAWLYGTLRNILKAKYRRLHAQNERQTDLTAVAELPLDSSPLDAAEEEIYSAELRAHLQTLLRDDEYRLLAAVHFDGLKMKEAAARLGLTEAAAKQKHYRICRKLKKILKNSKKFF